LRVAAVHAAHAEATHAESKAEDKYDTRGLEAAYLAAGQARLTDEAMVAINMYGGLFLKRFRPGEPIDLSALVELKMKKERFWYFIGPASGGMEVEDEGRTVLVLTPQSPLGLQLMGKQKGDIIRMKVSGLVDEYTITKVS
jgi:hypothetical protein